MPLSKRINNLHLTNGGEQGHGNLSPRAGPSSESNSMLQNGPGGYKPINGQNSHHHHNIHMSVNQAPPHVHQNGHGNRNPVSVYDPELSQADNPHYYHRNKLLYELHFIRSRRCHPDNA